MTLQEKQAKLERILLAYTNYYDIERENPEGNGEFAASAQFHSRSEKYVISKKAKLWGLEQNEYVYFFMGDVDAEGIESLIKKAIDLAMPQIKPHSEHMYSHVTLIVLADKLDDAAENVVKKARFQKSFRLSLHGWMEFRIAAVDFSAGKIISNKAGKSVRVLLEKNLQSQK